MNDNERLDLPSGSDAAFGKCPGKWNLLRSIAGAAYSEPVNQLAESGTRIHQAFQTGNTIELSDEEQEIYDSGKEYASKALEAWMSHIGLEGNVPPPATFEQRLWLHDDNLNPICSGQIDCYYKSGCEALILDLKTGWGSSLPSTTRSMQLRMYAVLLWKEHPNLNKIRVGYVAPRLFKGGSDDFTDYTRDDLRASEASIRMFLWHTEQKDAIRHAGAHCQYCRALGHCQEAAAYSMLPSVIASTAMAKKDASVEELVGAMTPQDCKRVWNMSGVIDKIVAATTARLKAMPKDQLAELGLELPEKGAKMSEFTHPDQIYDALCKSGMTGPEAWSVMSIKKTSIVGLVRRSFALKSDKEAAAWVEKNLSAHIETKFKAPSLIEVKKP